MTAAGRDLASSRDGPADRPRGGLGLGARGVRCCKGRRWQCRRGGFRRVQRSAERALAASNGGQRRLAPPVMLEDLGEDAATGRAAHAARPNPHVTLEGIEEDAATAGALPCRTLRL